MKGNFLHILLLFLVVQTGWAQVDVVNLRCEMLTNPLGIDEKKPRLGWQIEAEQRSIVQTGYEVLVASTEEKLHNNEGDVWNTGKVKSAQSIHITYAGKSLQSGKPYFWKVKVYTNKGETGWSGPAYWTMGLLNKTDWKAKWIGYDKPSPWDSISQWSRLSARYFRKEFPARAALKKATVYIAGLGFYELYINGKRIGDRVLAPAPTDYRKSVLYNTYDVTDNLAAGENVIAAILGNGRFFTMRQNYKTHKHNNFGFPKMLLQLEIEYENGTKQTITSDQSWKLNVNGPIRTNNEYDGEEYDATKEFGDWHTAGFDDGQWRQPQLVKAPAGRLVAQENEPMKVMKTISPMSIKKIGANKHILDMGQNFTGWIKLRVEGKRGQRVKLRFGESLQHNGELYVANLRDAKVTDIYTLKGTGVEEWQPSFVYHGFRFVEITGYPGNPAISDFEGQFVYDDLATTGNFNCSDPTINRVYQNAWWGIASNYKGMPVDCPQRNERQPWLGDRATGAGGEAFLFDNAKLYAKWLQDIEESQTPEGAIPDVAPAFWNYYSDNVTWPGTYIMVADMLYRQFGDKRAITRHYSSMKKWMNYMRSKYMVNYIVTKDKYGDWCVPPENLQMIRSRDSLRTTNGQLIATAYYFYLLKLMNKFAVITGNTTDTVAFEALGKKVGAAFQKKFYGNPHYYYANNTVTANLLPLYFGITPKNETGKVFENISNRIIEKDSMHISTGVIGTQWLMRGLTDHNREDIAFALASSKTYPGWGYMAEQGATTIWELWNGNTANPQMNSQNHVMLLGDLLIWLYEDLAGIRSDDSETAFKKIIMKPCLPAGLDEVNASYVSVYGKISSHWEKQAGELEWQVSIPANTSAVLHLPASSVDQVTESGKPLDSQSDLIVLEITGQHVIVEAGSGSYLFKVKSPSIQ